MGTLLILFERKSTTLIVDNIQVRAILADGEATRPIELCRHADAVLVALLAVTNERGHRPRP